MVYFETSSRNISEKAQHTTKKKKTTPFKVVGNKSKFQSFLGAFGKLWKATISFFLNARQSESPHETTRLPLDGFSWNLVFGHFSNIRRQNASIIKIRQE